MDEINEEEFNFLHALYKRRDPKVLAAWETYTFTKDWKDFCESLFIVCQFMNRPEMKKKATVLEQLVINTPLRKATRSILDVDEEDTVEATKVFIEHQHKIIMRFGFNAIFHMADVALFHDVNQCYLIF